MFDAGAGPPVVLIPGIQGRWEWMRPAVKALSRRHRVLAFSLDDLDASPTFTAWDAFLDRLLDAASVDRAAIIGVSFGGIIAAHYAASRAGRVSALILVSSPPPDWRLNARRMSYLDRPLRSAVPFAVRGVRNLVPEIMAAGASWTERFKLLSGHLGRVLRHPASPKNMAQWARAWQTSGEPVDLTSISAPTLVLTGEAHLDRVVPIAATLEYVARIAGARHVQLERTGHIGLVTKPERFADVVGRFLQCT